ncbi:MAG: transposase, partial [bacterium]|nr:transposase [bacterium]
MSTPLEVADIFRDYGEQYRQRHRLSDQQRRVMHAIEVCRTAALGGHLWVCDRCHAELPVYNSCGNRHCPKCQTLDKEKWIEARSRDLLPVEYFHPVFTVPDTLHELFLGNQKTLYDMLFRASKETLLQIGADPKHLGAKIGCIGVLHTWGSDMSFHPHTHFIVPGGGLS